MNQTLEIKLQSLPKKPGVYIYRDKAGMVLYVGKAVNLRNRVSSYFKKASGDRTKRIENMISQINDLDFVLCDNELESLILENNYIKELKPKYNVLLRDDKNYQFLKINLKQEIPTIEFERKASDRQARYFGPYTSGLSLKETLRLLRRIFPYCANSKVGTKPCFYYHIGKCPGVCFGKITMEEYKKHYIQNIIQFLEGRQMQILKDLQILMKTLAANGRFEKAAKVRDQIFALNRVLERQKLVYPKKVSQDVFSLYQAGVACINLFLIREGKLIRRENFILDNARGATPEEIFCEFLPKYYLDASDKPKEILLPVKISSEAASVVPKIVLPSRGKKAELIKLGEANAKQYLETTTDKNLLEEARLMASLKELQRVLSLPALPGRIEVYDISNIQGTNPVGSMVVADFGRPKKSDYRKFKINRKQTPDDFAMMSEMLERRFKRSEGMKAEKWPMPDLVVVDGGKGQLSTAVKVLNTYKLNIPIIGLAKRIEEIFLPGRKAPILLPVNSIALFLLQRMRDEAHRFAITYHRKLRSRSSLASVLDSISGIGPNKKRQLLQSFGSAAKIREASLTDIAAIVGAKAAEKIKASL
jgi:excinuclease ABC subunit C